MLTVTYTFVAISTEQKNARNELTGLCGYLRNCLQCLNNLDYAIIQKALNRVTQFDQYWRSRKLELYLIPAVRGLSSEVDALLAEIEYFTVLAAEKLKTVQQALHETEEASIDKLCTLVAMLESYCECLLLRLAKEEEELLPLLRRLLSNDEWFPIAAQFLSDEQKTHRRQHVSHPGMPVNIARQI